MSLGIPTVGTKTTGVTKAQPPKEKIGISFDLFKSSKRPDWSEDGFKVALATAASEAKKKEAWVNLDELCAFVAFIMERELKQKRVDVYFIARDKATKRPFLLVTLADRHADYIEIEVNLT